MNEAKPATQIWECRGCGHHHQNYEAAAFCCPPIELWVEDEGFRIDSAKAALSSGTQENEDEK